MSKRVWTDLAIAIPTFRRNEMLQQLLQSVEFQTVIPAMVLVVDNNPGGEAKSVVEDYQSKADIKVEYLRMGSNAGPAGAFAAALSYLSSHPSNPKWMACRDDDLAFEGLDRLARLQALAITAPPEAGGVGIWGKYHYPRSTGPEHGPFPVDLITGGGEPVYKIPALVHAGVTFNEKLLFGFEELDIGLRLRRAGLALLTEELKPSTHFTGERRTADWRNYFGERNWLMISREFEPFHLFIYYSLRALASSVKRLVRGGQRSTAIACLLGAIDGIRGAKARPFYIP